MEIITAEEKTKLQARMNELIANRSVITDRIAEARALGDLKENAEYHAAREQQGLEEAEIRRLQERVTTANVVEPGGAAEGVVFLGSTVKLKDIATGDEDLFKLVGESTDSDDPDIVEVTTSSPMGEALIKARLGEVVSVRAPRGMKKFEIIEIN